MDSSGISIIVLFDDYHVSACLWHMLFARRSDQRMRSGILCHFHRFASSLGSSYRKPPPLGKLTAIASFSSTYFFGTYARIEVVASHCMSQLFEVLQLQLVLGGTSCPSVFLALPPSPSYHHYALVWLWARMCRYELVRQYRVRGSMYFAQTIGGGWASVKNVERSLFWALHLYRLALAIGDESCMRKCRVFVGWAHLWNGDQSLSTAIFQQQLQHAAEAGDIQNQFRCIAALLHSTARSAVRHKEETVVQQLDSQWQKIFGDALNLSS